MRKNSFIFAIVFLSFYLLDNAILYFLIFKNIDFMEVYICSMFIGVLQSLYFLLKLSKRQFYFFFPFYYTLCCALCVFGFQFISVLIFTHEINLKAFASLFHNIFVTEVFYFLSLYYRTLRRFCYSRYCEQLKLTTNLRRQF